MLHINITQIYITFMKSHFIINTKYLCYILTYVQPEFWLASLCWANTGPTLAKSTDYATNSHVCPTLAKSANHATTSQHRSDGRILSRNKLDWWSTIGSHLSADVMVWTSRILPIHTELAIHAMNAYVWCWCKTSSTLDEIPSVTMGSCTSKSLNEF